MTFPIHTVKHVKAAYRRRQIITVILTFITLAAALMTAVSGMQLAKLRKKQAAVELPTAPAIPAVQQQAVDDNLIREIEELKLKLEAEKKNSDELKTDIASLQKKLSETKVVAPVPVPEPTPKAAPASAVPQQKQVAAPAAAETPAQPETTIIAPQPQQVDTPNAQPAPQTAAPPIEESPTLMKIPSAPAPSSQPTVPETLPSATSHGVAPNEGQAPVNAVPQPSPATSTPQKAPAGD